MQVLALGRQHICHDRFLRVALLVFPEGGGGAARARPLRNFARRVGANVLRNIGGKRGSGMSFHGAGMAIHGAGLRGKRVLPRYGSGKRRV